MGASRQVGGIHSRTKVNLWDGGTVPIGQVVRGRLTPTLVGMEPDGTLVPAEVLDWVSHGTQDSWVGVEVDCLVTPSSGSAGHPNVVRMGPAQELWTPDGPVPVRALTPGGQVLTQDRRPDANVLHAIRSSMLGDGSVLRRSGQQKVSCFQEPHANSDYSAYLNAWLGECATEVKHTLSGYGSQLSWSSSSTYRALTAVRDEWYPEGVKVVPPDLSWMDDFAVAKWYMDDGSLSHSEAQEDRARFATNGFQQGEVERLAAFLTARYGVSCTVHFAKGWCLRVNAGRNREIERFWEAVAPHVVPPLRYKLPRRHRKVPYVPRADGREERFARAVEVLGLASVLPAKRAFPYGRLGVGLVTTTGNLLAKGVVIAAERAAP